MIHVVKHKNFWFIFSGALTILSIIAISIWGLKPAIDFTGGTLIEMQFTGVRPEKIVVEEVFQKTKLEHVQLQPLGDSGFLARLPFIDAQKHTELSGNMDGAFRDAWREERFDTIGPSVSKELKTNTAYAIFWAALAITLYIAWAFRRVSEPVKSWKYGISAIIALLHDIIIPTGVFAVLGHFLGMEVDVLFVTALLTIMGFSVHDTIVTFDRIRENLLKRRHDAFETIVEDSINQTIARSINTTLTTLLSLFAVLLFGGEMIRPFALALIIGIGCGAYSSIFLASLLLVQWNRRGK